jgi:hypothetical protein
MKNASALGIGYLNNQSSFGTYAGDPGEATAFGFLVRYNRKLTDITGYAGIVVRSHGRIYLFGANAIESLVVNRETGEATFLSRANLKDITNLAHVISLRDGLTLHVTLTDQRAPAVQDTIAISVWDGNELLFASNWDGVQAIEQPLDGGDLVVRPSSGVQGGVSQTTQDTSGAVPNSSGDGETYDGTPVLLGDMDFDGDLDYDDIAPFLLGLGNPVGYEATYGRSAQVAGDVDSNGVFEFDDITAFAARLGVRGIPAFAAGDSAALVGLFQSQGQSQQIESLGTALRGELETLDARDTAFTQLSTAPPTVAARKRSGDRLADSASILVPHRSSAARLKERRQWDHALESLLSDLDPWQEDYGTDESDRWPI